MGGDEAERRVGSGWEEREEPTAAVLSKSQSTRCKWLRMLHQVSKPSSDKQRQAATHCKAHVQ